MAIADKELSFSTGVKAKTSGHRTYQFIEATWLKTGATSAPGTGSRRRRKRSTGSMTSSSSPIRPRRRASSSSGATRTSRRCWRAEMLKRDRNRIGKRIGRELTDGETYLAHFLGPDDAERFLEKVVGEPKAGAVKLLPRPARANRSIFDARTGRKLKGLSVAEVHSKFERMMGLRLDRYRNVQIRSRTRRSPGEAISPSPNSGSLSAREPIDILDLRRRVILGLI